MLLRLAGFNVRVFGSAEGLLVSKVPTANTCLLLDLYMPGMKGLELYKLLANAGRQMPTVLMSGRDDEETKKLARGTTDATVLFKPFDQSALLRAIWRALQHSLT